jgi:hypothetical protein
MYMQSLTTLPTFEYTAHLVVGKPWPLAILDALSLPPLLLLESALDGLDQSFLAILWLVDISYVVELT